MQSFKKKIQDYFGVCDIDLFASSKKYKIKTYASMKPNIYASVTDAFSLSWKVFNLCYMSHHSAYLVE